MKLKNKLKKLRIGQFSLVKDEYEQTIENKQIWDITGIG